MQKLNNNCILALTSPDLMHMIINIIFCVELFCVTLPRRRKLPRSINNSAEYQTLSLKLKHSTGEAVRK